MNGIFSEGCWLLREDFDDCGLFILLLILNEIAKEHSEVQKAEKEVTKECLSLYTLGFPRTSEEMQDHSGVTNWLTGFHTENNWGTRSAKRRMLFWSHFLNWAITTADLPMYVFRSLSVAKIKPGSHFHSWTGCCVQMKFINFTSQNQDSRLRRLYGRPRFNFPNFVRKQRNLSLSFPVIVLLEKVSLKE